MATNLVEAVDQIVRDPVRLSVLRRTELLDSPAEEAFDRLTRLACRVLDAPVALITLLDADRQFFKSCFGLPDTWAAQRERPLSRSFCQYALAMDGPLVIDDIHVHPLLHDHPAVPELGLRAYLGVPLVSSQGHALGTFCVIDMQPRTWSEEQVSLLRDIVASAVTEIELRLDIAERGRTERLLQEQGRILELVARGVALPEVLEELMRMVEEHSPGMLCSILLLDESGERLRSGAAPSLPRSYCQALDGVPVFPYIGPCGLAAHERRQVIVSDIASDARWSESFRQLAAEHKLHSCWSSPVFSGSDEVLGTFAIYYREPRTPSPADRELIGLVTHLAQVAIERRRTEAQREAALREAETANRAKSQFLAMMSHELRTPLNAIAGYAELLEMGIHGPLTEQQRESLHRIRRSQHHLLSLINEVLNFAKIEAGNLRYELRDLLVEELLSDVQPLIGPQLQMSGLRYACHVEEPGLAVHADAEKVQQILLNLFSNAVRYTEAGGAVTVSCDGDARTVRIRVHDTGCGIAPDKLESVFEPFIQLDKSLTRTREGTGLGLAISRDLARGMGGDLSAQSQLGRGSTFTLTLPRGHASAAGERTHTELPEPSV